MDAEYWEEHHRRADHADHPPNPQVVAELADVTPGTALDAGCGDGANAMWLAERGWQVAAVDISPTAVRRGREIAESRGLADRMTWVEADVTAAPLGDPYDLVISTYVHPAGRFDELLLRLAGVVKRGGTLLIVGHDPADPHSQAHAPSADVSFVAEDAARLLDPGWDVEVAGTRRRENDWHGVALDTVLRARRR